MLLYIALENKPWSFSVFASLVASVIPQEEREPFSLLTFMSILVKHVVWYVVDYLSAHISHILHCRVVSPVIL